MNLECQGILFGFLFSLFDWNWPPSSFSFLPTWHKHAHLLHEAKACLFACMRAAKRAYRICPHEVRLTAWRHFHHFFFMKAFSSLFYFAFMSVTYILVKITHEGKIEKSDENAFMKGILPSVGNWYEGKKGHIKNCGITLIIEKN